MRLEPWRQILTVSIKNLRLKNYISQMCSDNKSTTVGYQKVILQRQIVEIVDSYNILVFFLH